jgi:hypothetical protein
MGTLTSWNPLGHPRPITGLLSFYLANSTGVWVGPRAGLDGCGKSRPPPGLNPRTVQLSRPTEPVHMIYIYNPHYITYRMF